MDTLIFSSGWPVSHPCQYPDSYHLGLSIGSSSFSWQCHGYGGIHHFQTHPFYPMFLHPPMYSYKIDAVTCDTTWRNHRLKWLSPGSVGCILMAVAPACLCGALKGLQWWGLRTHRLRLWGVATYLIIDGLFTLASLTFSGLLLIITCGKSNSKTLIRPTTVFHE